MTHQHLLLAVFIVIILVIVYWSHTRSLSESLTAAIISQDPRSFYQLTDGEKIQYIIDTYFNSSEQDVVNAAKIKQENQYITSLPVDDQSCVDNYDDCPKWAADNECIINPEYMLYNCPKSCKACSLKPQDKYNLVNIYNTRDPPNCVYHDQTKIHSYPDPGRYIREFENYYNEDHII
jgi:hypothetical protein